MSGDLRSQASVVVPEEGPRLDLGVGEEADLRNNLTDTPFWSGMREAARKGRFPWSRTGLPRSRLRAGKSCVDN